MSEKRKIKEKIAELEEYRKDLLYGNHNAADADVISQAISDTEYEIMVLSDYLEIENNLAWFRWTLYAAIAVIIGSFIFVTLNK